MTDTTYADRYLALRDDTPMFLKLLRSNPPMFAVFGMEGFALAPGKPEEAAAPEPETAAEPVPAPVADADEHPWLRQIAEQLSEPEPEVDETVARFNQAHDEQAGAADDAVWQSSERPGQVDVGPVDLPRPAGNDQYEIRQTAAGFPRDSISEEASDQPGQRPTVSEAVDVRPVNAPSGEPDHTAVIPAADVPTEALPEVAP